MLKKKEKEDFSEEIEVSMALDAAKEEAIKTVTNAFNEGFLLGLKHAKNVFNDTYDDVFGGSDENKS